MVKGLLMKGERLMNYVGLERNGKCLGKEWTETGEE